MARHKARRARQKNPESIFLRRTSNIFHCQRRRAREAGDWIDYTLEILRHLIRHHLNKGTCRYCGNVLTVKNFSVDHLRPVARGGSFNLANLVPCCIDCNQIKGPLDQVEFRELLQLTSQWSPRIQAHLFARLKAGARHAKLPGVPSATESPANHRA